MSRRVVRIDSLVVHGGAVPSSSGEALARSVKMHLAQLLLAQRGAADLQGANVVRTKARPGGDRSTAAIGKALAESVHTAIRGRA
jgi:hypothetical protein